jgi:ABC transporter DrrB family efflux protein
MTTTATTTSSPLASSIPKRSADSGGLKWAISDTLAITQRNLTGMFRVPQILVFSLVQPVIFVLMFRYVFGGSITIPGLNYVDYLMPGIFVQTATFGAINTAVGLAEDKGKGLLERMQSLPMARSAVLTGRVLADTTRNVFIVLLMLAIGLAVGFRPSTNPLMIAAGLGVMILFGIALCWLFVTIGLSVSNGEAAQAASFPLLAPLTFASNLFASPDTMPGWLQWWARHQPVSATADAVRACMNGGPTATKLITAISWSLGMSALFATIAITRYRKA